MNVNKIEEAGREYAKLLEERNPNTEAYNFSGAFIDGAFWMLCNMWTSVKDEMPEEKSNGESKLVFVRIDISGGEYSFDTNYTKNGEWVLNKTLKVTHWMQIPSLLEKT